MFRNNRLRRFRRRFKRKATGFRRRFRRVKRGLGSTAKRFFKLRRIVTVTMPAAQPLWLQFNDNPSLSQDWVQVSDLFQMYRVNGIKLQFIPGATVRELGSNTTLFVPMYIVHDTNYMINSIPSENEMLQYEGMKIRPMNRMWSHYQKMARRINPTATTSLSTDGYSTVTNPQVTQQLSMLIPAIQSASAYTIGRIVVTAYVTAKIRR